MERTQLFELKCSLKAYGMRSAYTEVMTLGIERQRNPPRIAGDMLPAEFAEKRGRLIKYRRTVTNPPLAKYLDDFEIACVPADVGLAREPATGTLVAEHRKFVLVGSTGSGKSHLIMVGALIRDGMRSDILERRRAMMGERVLVLSIANTSHNSLGAT